MTSTKSTTQTRQHKPVRKAVFPVAGLGTRFLPATKAMPKEMLTVVDKPIIQYAVEEAIAAGITEIIFVTGRGKSAIENHFDKPYELSDTLNKRGKLKELKMVEDIVPEHVRIYYTRQGEPKGLGHAVWCAKEIIGDEPFAVLLPDDIIWNDEGRGHSLRQMCDIYEETGKPVVLTSEVSKDNTRKYGILDVNGEKMSGGRVPVSGFVEKPQPDVAPSNFAITGRYVLTPEILDILESAEPGHGGEIQITDAMDKVARDSGFYGCLNTGHRFDCGDKLGFQMANLFFAMQDEFVAPRLRTFLKSQDASATGTFTHIPTLPTFGCDESRKLNVTMIGSGYVGLVSGTCFADLGFNVTCVDTNAEKIENLKKGVMPIYEPGLDKLVEKNTANGRLSFTTDLGSAVKDSDVVFIAVGTPQGEDGSADLTYVKQAAKDIAPHLNGFTVIVNKSTVPVGTTVTVTEAVKSVTPDADFEVVSNPEFLREGCALFDFMQPDRVVVGALTERARSVMRTLYRPLEEAHVPVMFTAPTSAELIKYAANGFLAMKISFINEIAALSEKTGADVSDVARGIGLDHRIGSAFLNPGPGYGGSCFPKDTRALAEIGRTFGAEQKLIETAIAVNSAQQKRAAEKVKETMGPLSGKTLAVLGLAFKGNTDDMRESPALGIIPLLEAEGATIKAFDPQAMKNASTMLPKVQMTASIDEALQQADGAVIMTEWDDFRSILPATFKSALKTPTIVDLRNLYNAESMTAAGLTYVSLGRESQKSA